MRLKELLQTLDPTNEQGEILRAIEEAERAKEIVGPRGYNPSKIAFELALDYLTHGGLNELNSEGIKELREFAERYLHRSIKIGFLGTVEYYRKNGRVQLASDALEELAKLGAPTQEAVRHAEERAAMEKSAAAHMEQKPVTLAKGKNQPWWKRPLFGKRPK